MRPAYREILERLIAVGQVRFPALADLARELRYRRFDQPALERGRAEAYAQADADLTRLPQADDAERDAIVARLVECVQPLGTEVVARMVGAPLAARARLIETTLRRLYRFRSLGQFTSGTIDDLAVATADFQHDSARFRLMGCAGPYIKAAEVLQRLAPAVGAAERDCQLLLELFLWQETSPLPADETAAQLALALASAGFNRDARRVSMAVASAVRDHRVAIEYFTFRYDPSGWREERYVRGVPYMLAQRMQFGRLIKFHLVRLPSVPDVYLYHAIARARIPRTSGSSPWPRSATLPRSAMPGDGLCSSLTWSGRCTRRSPACGSFRPARAS